MIRATILAACIALPAQADDVDICRALSEIAYQGALDGFTLESIPDGLKPIVEAQGDEMEFRAMVSVYLSGYAQGLVFAEAAETAAAMFAGCMSEGV